MSPPERFRPRRCNRVGGRLPRRPRRRGGTAGRMLFDIATTRSEPSGAASSAPTGRDDPRSGLLGRRDPDPTGACHASLPRGDDQLGARHAGCAIRHDGRTPGGPVARRRRDGVSGHPMVSVRHPRRIRRHMGRDGRASSRPGGALLPAPVFRDHVVTVRTTCVRLPDRIVAVGHGLAPPARCPTGLFTTATKVVCGVASSWPGPVRPATCTERP